MSESLSNNTGRISLQQPNDIDALGEFSSVVVDEVVYDDLPPFPDADGSGQSLERVDFNDSGSFASNWIAATPTPGVLNRRSYWAMQTKTASSTSWTSHRSSLC